MSLEQPAGEAVDGLDHPAMGRNLPDAHDHRHDQEQQTEGGDDAEQSRIVDQDQQNRRRQENHREHGIRHHPLHGVAQGLERHSPHREIARRVALQKPRRQAEQAVPEGGLYAGCGAPFEAHERHSLEDVQQRPHQAQRRQCRGHRIQQGGLPGRDHLVGDEAHDHGRRQHDQTGQQPRRHVAREVHGQPLSGELQQIPEIHPGGSQRPIENPGIAGEVFGALGGDPGTAFRHRIHRPIAPQRARQQGYRSAVGGAKGQHGAAVARDGGVSAVSVTVELPEEGAPTGPSQEVAGSGRDNGSSMPDAVWAARQSGWLKNTVCALSD